MNDFTSGKANARQGRMPVKLRSVKTNERMNEHTRGMRILMGGEW